MSPMQPATLLVVLATMYGVSLGSRLVFKNNLSYSVWVGAIGNPGKPNINNGGWKMNPGQEMSFNVDQGWAGRVWGRTGCNFDQAGNGRCETGDCNRRLQCQVSGQTPATLAEITFNGDAGSDFYDVSLVDGFNIPISMIPLDQRPASAYSCNTVACPKDINPLCPNELKLISGGRVVGCKSACAAFPTSDTYCCRGAHSTPQTCRSSDWPVNYPSLFKRHCPQAYSYAYDDQKSTFTCKNTGYKIQFG